MAASPSTKQGVRLSRKTAACRVRRKRCAERRRPTERCIQGQDGRFATGARCDQLLEDRAGTVADANFQNVDRAVGEPRTRHPHVLVFRRTIDADDVHGHLRQKRLTVTLTGRDELMRASGQVERAARPPVALRPPWPFAPGVSGQCATCQRPSRSNIAVNSFRMRPPALPRIVLPPGWLGRSGQLRFGNLTGPVCIARQRLRAHATYAVAAWRGLRQKGRKTVGPAGPVHDRARFSLYRAYLGNQHDPAKRHRALAP